MLYYWHNSAIKMEELNNDKNECLNQRRSEQLPPNWSTKLRLSSAKRSRSVGSAVNVLSGFLTRTQNCTWWLNFLFVVEFMSKAFLRRSLQSSVTYTSLYFAYKKQMTYRDVITDILRKLQQYFTSLNCCRRSYSDSTDCTMLLTCRW